MRVDRTAQLKVCVGVLLVGAGSSPALAIGLGSTWVADVLQNTHNAAGLAVLIGLTVFATILSLLHLRERSRWARRELDLSTEVARLDRASDLAELLLNAERQVIVTWAGRGNPVIEGDVTLAFPAGQGHDGLAHRVLDFTGWLTASDAAVVEDAVHALRDRGTGFRLSLRADDGRYMEAHGQALAGRALLRLRETSEERRQLNELRHRLDEARRGLAALSGLLDAIPQPVWQRDRDGALAWVNTAYVSAVEAPSREGAVVEGTELLDRQARESIARQDDVRSASGGRGAMRLSAVVAGGRRILDVTETVIEGGRVGIAVDV